MTAVITKGKTENSVFPRDNQPAGNCCYFLKLLPADLDFPEILFCLVGNREVRPILPPIPPSHP